MELVLNISAPSSLRLPHNSRDSKFLSSNSQHLAFSRHFSSFPRFSSSTIRWQPKQLAISVTAAVTVEKKDKSPAEEVQVTVTKLPQSSVRLSVAVPSNVCQQCYRRVLDEFSKQSKIPGFRPGKRVPENILVNYIGKENVHRATIEATLRKALPQALSSVEGRALEDSVRIITKFSEMDETFNIRNPFRFDVVVDVAPEIKWLSENAYKALKVVVEIDDAINAQKASEIEFRRRHKALGALKIVTERGLQMGDLVVLDIFATTIKEGEAGGEKIPSAETEGLQLDMDESDNLLPGFIDSIVGIRQGETRSFPLIFPDTWKQESLQGVAAQFTVVCKELFYRDLPDLDDSIAEKLLPGCSTLSQVRETIVQRCKEVEQTAIEQATDNAILDQLSKIVEADIPQSLFEEQGRQLYGAKLLELQANRKLTESQLASLSSERAVKEYFNNQRDNIIKITKQMLAVSEIFRSENLQVEADELIKEVENSIAEFKRENQEYDEDRIKDQVQDVLEGAKVLEWLRENADIQYIWRSERYN